MEDFDPFASFGPDVAEGYDEDLRGDEPETVDYLATLAGDGPVLEFAIGTGRITLPLAERGLRVDGIEQSAAMVGKLRAKPGGADLDALRRILSRAVPAAPERTTAAP